MITRQTRIIYVSLTLPLFLYMVTIGLAKQLEDIEAQRHYEKAKRYSLISNKENDILAEKEFKLAIRMRKNRYPEAWREYCRFLADKLRFAEAVKAMKYYVIQTPSGVDEGDKNIMRELVEASDLQKRLTRRTRHDLKDQIKYVHLIATYKKDNLKTAINYAQKIVDSRPKSVEAIVLLARYLNLTTPPQRTESRELLNRASKLSPNNPDIFSELGYTYYNTECDLAVTQFRHALRLSNNQHGEAWHGLARSLKCLGKWEEAIQAFKMYLAVGNPPITYRLEIEREINAMK